MKRTVFVAMLVSIGFGVKAQTESGNFLVGGTFQLNTAKNNTEITLNPSAGYFFVDNFAAGANVILSYLKKGETIESKATTLGIGPFVRYYVGAADIRPFIHADVNFTSSKTKVGSEASTTLTGTSYFFGPGAAFFLNQNVALEGLAGYDHFAYANQKGSGGFAFRLGFQIYLTRGQVRAVTTNP